MTAINQYATNPYTWVCACPSYLHSRFLLCKHFIHCFNIQCGPRHLATTIERRHTVPYWVSSQLTVKDNVRNALGPAPDVMPSNDMVDNDLPRGDAPLADARPIPQLPNALSPQNDGVTNDKHEEQAHEKRVTFLKDMPSLLEIAQQEHEAGNDRFVDAFMASNRRYINLLNAIHSQRQQRTLPQTWRYDGFTETKFL